MLHFLLDALQSLSGVDIDYIRRRQLVVIVRLISASIVACVQYFRKHGC